jgi:hypothetical protein
MFPPSDVITPSLKKSTHQSRGAQPEKAFAAIPSGIGSHEQMMHPAGTSGEVPDIPRHALIKSYRLKRL